MDILYYLLKQNNSYFTNSHSVGTSKGVPFSWVFKPHHLCFSTMLLSFNFLSTFIIFFPFVLVHWYLYDPCRGNSQDTQWWICVIPVHKCTSLDMLAVCTEESNYGHCYKYITRYLQILVLVVKLKNWKDNLSWWLDWQSVNLGLLLMR